jgi:hypothetical protein
MKSTSVIAGVVAIGLLIGTAAVAQVSVDASAGLSAQVSTEVSSPLSGVSSQVSSALTSASGEVSSALNSSSSMNASSMMMDEQGCTDVGTLMTGTMAMDAAALAAVTSVSVVSVDDCSGLPETDAGTNAEIAANPLVVDAFAASGQVGAEVVAYTLDGTSLTVYVRSRS